MKQKLVLIYVLLLFSCSSISDHSDDESFSHIVDKEVSLTKSLLVCESKPLKTQDAKQISYELSYRRNSPNKCAFGTIIEKLPIGATIIIHRIEKHSILGTKPVEHWYFIGQSKFNNGELFDFYYFHGLTKNSDETPW